MPVTINDIARELGFAKSTVSRALNGGSIAPEKRDAVMKMVEQMGFEADPTARRLSSGRCELTIGLLALNLDFGVVTGKIKEIQRRLSERGFNVPIHSYGSFGGGESVDEIGLVRLLAREKPRAIVCHTTELPDSTFEELRRFRENGGGVVCFDTLAPDDFDQVRFDFADDAEQVARFFFANGHRRALMMTHGRAQTNELRWSGWQKAAREAGIRVSRDEFWEETGALYEEAGFRFAERFLALEKGVRPTAVYAINDNVAAGFMTGISEAGLQIPRDVAVIGHDDQAMCRCLTPRLSSFVHPVSAIAQATVEVLLERLEQNGEFSPPIHRVVRGELVNRASSQFAIAQHA